MSDKPPRFSNQIVVFITTLTVCLTAALTWFAVSVSREQALAEQGQYLAGIADRVAQQIDITLMERLADIRQLADSPLFRRDGNGNGGMQRRSLQYLRDSSPAFAWMGVTDPQGTIVLASDGLLEQVSVAHRPWFQRCRKKALVMDLHEAELLQQLLAGDTSAKLRFVDVCAPIVDESGNYRGVLGAHLYINWAADLLERVLKPPLDNLNLDVVVSNEDDIPIFGREASPAELQGLRNRAINQGFVKEIWLSGEPGYTGVATASGHLGFDGLGWRVLVHRSGKSVIGPIRAGAIQVAMTGAFVGSVFLLIGFWVTRRLVAPIRSLSAKISEAHQVIDLEELDEYQPYLELQELVVKLRQMALRVQHGDRELAVHLQQGLAQQDAIRNLEVFANTDALTAVMNRRAFEPAVNAMIKRYRQPADGFHVALLDLDHFKAVNDTYGHIAGDRVLIAVAKAVVDCLAPEDRFARIGGEEFGVLFPEADPIIVQQKLEFVRETLEQLEITSDQHVLRITCSIGATANDPADTVVSDLFGRADGALYAAKYGGRNCVRFFSEKPD